MHHGVAILAVLLATACPGSGRASAQVPAPPPCAAAMALPTPTGKHAVGVRASVVRDPARPETITPQADDVRELLVQIWYPASTTGGQRRRYMRDRVAEAWSKRMPLPVACLRAVRTNAREDAPLSAAQPRWPVLLFSHGMSWPVANYQAILEELASHGFVVVAVEHTYATELTELPDGRTFPFSLWSGEHASEEARVRALVGHLPTWVADLRTVLGHLEGLARDRASPFHARLDVARVGVVGHSYGGSAAAVLANEDARVAAAMSIEGAVHDPAARRLAVDRPLAYVIGGYNRNELLGHYRPGKVLYELVVEGAWHSSFSDLIYLYEPIAPAAWRDRHRYELAPERALRITTDLAIAFFGKYLRGQDSVLLHPRAPADLGAPATAGYAELELRIDVP